MLRMKRGRDSCGVDRKSEKNELLDSTRETPAVCLSSRPGIFAGNRKEKVNARFARVDEKATASAGV